MKKVKGYEAHWPLPYTPFPYLTNTATWLPSTLLDHSPQRPVSTSIVTFTNCLGSDIRVILTSTSLTAEQLTQLFFKEWYCESGLPLKILLDHDKLLVSYFWRALHKLIRIKLKRSSAYHPQSYGASEQTSKTVIQCIWFMVEQDQRGWVQDLPKSGLIS